MLILKQTAVDGTWIGIYIYLTPKSETFPSALVIHGFLPGLPSPGYCLAFIVQLEQRACGADSSTVPGLSQWVAATLTLRYQPLIEALIYFQFRNWRFSQVQILLEQGVRRCEF